MGAIGCATAPRPVRLEPPRFDDAELRAELMLQAPSRRVRLALINHGDRPVAVKWDELSLVGADHRLAPVPVRGLPDELAPGARIEVQLPLDAPEGAQLELIVPTVVRGVQREYHYRVRLLRS